MRDTLLRSLDLDLVPCYCGHLREEHKPGFFNPCPIGGCACEDYEPDPVHAVALAVEDGTSHESDRLTLAAAEDLVGEPATAWPGRCYEIADTLFRRAAATGAPIPGRVVYGHYRGVVHPDSLFAGRAHLGWVQHGWIDLDDGTVLDPTRWVFECATPYLYEGPATDYDEGGNILRAARTRPCPAVTGEGPAKALEVSAAAARHLTALTAGTLTVAADGSLPLTGAQTFWLANLPLPVLGEHASEIYTALEAVGARALIPIDNRLKVTASTT